MSLHVEVALCEQGWNDTRCVFLAGQAEITRRELGMLRAAREHLPREGQVAHDADRVLWGAFDALCRGTVVMVDLRSPSTEHFVAVLAMAARAVERVSKGYWGTSEADTLDAIAGALDAAGSTPMTGFPWDCDDGPIEPEPFEQATV
jgi:hypothetical protein